MGQLFYLQIDFAPMCDETEKWGLSWIRSNEIVDVKHKVEATLDFIQRMSSVGDISGQMSRFPCIESNVDRTIEA